ncbi:MAG: transcription antitermination factor NusB [Rhodospirillaceae bacterium]
MNAPKTTKRRNRTGGGSAKARRSAARLAAVQALYQIEQGGGTYEAVRAEFIKLRLGHEVDGISYVAAEPLLFSSIVRGVGARINELDLAISAALDPRLPLERLELLLRAILRAGAWELLANIEIDAPIIISDYVAVAHAFYAERETGLINGVLDTLAGRLRRPTAPTACTIKATAE